MVRLGLAAREVSLVLAAPARWALVWPRPGLGPEPGPGTQLGTQLGPGTQPGAELELQPLLQSLPPP